jgi:hypothetical protein
MLLLGRSAGYAGIAAGSIAGVCLVSLPVNGFTAARQLDLAWLRLAQPLWPWFWRFSMVAAGCAMASHYWTPHSMGGFVISTMAVCLIYGLVQVGPLLDSSLGLYLRQAQPFVKDALRRLLWTRSAAPRNETQVIPPIF